jgi:hypothetical protein
MGASALAKPTANQGGAATATHEGTINSHLFGPEACEIQKLPLYQHLKVGLEHQVIAGLEKHQRDRQVRVQRAFKQNPVFIL